MLKADWMKHLSQIHGSLQYVSFTASNYQVWKIFDCKNYLLELSTRQVVIRNYNKIQVESEITVFLQISRQFQRLWY